MYLVVQSHSCVLLFETPWTGAYQASLFFAISQSLLRFMSIDSVMLSNHLILCHPLLLMALIFLSIRVFSKESALRIRWSKFWSLNFSISPSNEYWVLISFRIDWFDLLAVQGTLKSLLQHHSSEALMVYINFLKKFLLEYKENWVLKNWCFEQWCWRRLLRVPWTARRSNKSILKEIGPEYSLEQLMLKLQYFGHLMQS